MIIFLYNMITSWARGPIAAANPWRAQTLEWQVSSPPPLFNFDEIPQVVGGPYEYGVPGAQHAVLSPTGSRGGEGGRRRCTRDAHADPPRPAREHQPAGRESVLSRRRAHARDAPVHRLGDHALRLVLRRLLLRAGREPIAPPWPPAERYPGVRRGGEHLILVTSSFTMHWALQSIKSGRAQAFKAGLVLTLLMGTRSSSPRSPSTRRRLRAGRQRLRHDLLLPHRPPWRARRRRLDPAPVHHPRLPGPLLPRAPSRRRAGRHLLALRRRDVDRRVHDGLHLYRGGVVWLAEPGSQRSRGVPMAASHDSGLRGDRRRERRSAARVGLPPLILASRPPRGRIPAPTRAGRDLAQGIAARRSAPRRAADPGRCERDTRRPRPPQRRSAGGRGAAAGRRCSWWPALNTRLGRSSDDDSARADAQRRLDESRLAAPRRGSTRAARSATPIRSQASRTR